MKKLWFFAIAVGFLLVPATWAQQVDLGFGVGTTIAPGAASASGSFTPQTMGGGAYLDFNGDARCRVARLGRHMPGMSSRLSQSGQNRWSRLFRYTGHLCPAIVAKNGLYRLGELASP